MDSGKMKPKIGNEINRVRKVNNGAQAVSWAVKENI